MFRKFLQRSIKHIPWRLRIRIKRLPLVSRWQRYLLAEYVEGTEFVHTVDAGPAAGLKYPLTLPADKGIWVGTYELEFAARLAESVEPRCICADIGAWRGFFSGVMGLAKARKVYAFEPSPTNCMQIRKMIALNPGLPLQLFEAAVGETTGTLDFHIMADSSMGKVATSSFQAGSEPIQRIQAPVYSLDHLVSRGWIDVPDLVKIDVEGAEASVLRGASQCLRQRKPILFIEIHSHALGEECFTILSATGYSVSVLETKLPPDFRTEPVVCHYVAEPKRQ